MSLERFITAQAQIYPRVLAELKAGRKQSHWMWFIFPQIAGLSGSYRGQLYAIQSLQEARAYLAHPVLGARLRECATAVLSSKGRTAVEIFGSVDAVKVRSSMTLFHRAAPADPVFAAVLDRFYESRPDETTDALLGSSSAEA